MVTKRYVLDGSIGFKPKYSIHDLTEKQFLLIRDLLGLTMVEHELFARLCNSNPSTTKTVFLDSTQGDWTEISNIEVEER